MKQKEPTYDLSQMMILDTESGKLKDNNKIYIIGKEFEKMDSLYIADGHHRAASAVKLA